MAIVTDNKYMEYDYNKHMYIPTKMLFKDKLNIDIATEEGGTEEENAFLEDVSYFIKDFCINYANSWDFDKTKKQIEFRIFENAVNEVEHLQRAYVELVRYAFNDEGDLVGIQTGLNLIKGQITPLEELRGRRELSGRLERILRISGLLYRGQRVWEVDPDNEYTYGTDY